jgi:hypothetical protein
VLENEGWERDYDVPEPAEPLRPVTKREADMMAVKLFCLFSFILVVLIVAGVL